MGVEQFIAALCKQAIDIADLRQARLHSDRKEYRSKRRILTQAMSDAPEEWEIDQPDERMPGITHKSTKFRFHLPARHVNSVLPKAAITRTKDQSMDAQEFVEALVKQAGAVPYALGGAAAGGLAGALLGGGGEDPKESRKQKLLAALLGAGAGAVGGYGLGSLVGGGRLPPSPAPPPVPPSGPDNGPADAMLPANASTDTGVRLSQTPQAAVQQPRGTHAGGDLGVPMGLEREWGRGLPKLRRADRPPLQTQPIAP